MKDWKAANDNDIVCYCRNVDKKTITDAVKSGAVTLKMIQNQTSACTKGNCAEMNPSGKCCSSDIIELIRIYLENTNQSNCSCCSNS